MHTSIKYLSTLSFFFLSLSRSPLSLSLSLSLSIPPSLFSLFIQTRTRACHPFPFFVPYLKEGLNVVNSLRDKSLSFAKKCFFLPKKNVTTISDRICEHRKKCRPRANFTNVLCAAFMCVSWRAAF
jgi:hypothetical protein